jgi:catechol 2,3-dioxygenase-like lactoylglutathione lyase family enzyme
MENADHVGSGGSVPHRIRQREANGPGKRGAGVWSQPLIAVRDVRASGRWYGQLLGVDTLREHEHRGVYLSMLCDGHLVLQLHAWDEEDHPNLVNADAAPPGHGVLLWFEVDDFDAAVKRARSLRANVVEEPHVNPQAHHREIWIRDPDGYVVVIASTDSEAEPFSGQRSDRHLKLVRNAPSLLS